MKFIVWVVLALLFLSCEKAEDQPRVHPAATEGQIQIDVIVKADSLNQLTLSVLANSGVSLQTVLEKSLKIGYADPAKKFINAIGGFEAQKEERQFWYLEVNGKSAEVGASELILEEDANIKCELKTY